MKSSGRVKKLRKSLSSFNAFNTIRAIIRGRGPGASKDGRRIKIDVSRGALLIDERTGKPYKNNLVKSSRYNIWNFLPCQLLFQFTKLANAYLLALSILHFIPNLAPTANYTAVIPLTILISISMGKEGYDDIRRYKLDKAENNSQTTCLKPASSQTNAPSSGLFNAFGLFNNQRNSQKNNSKNVSSAVDTLGPSWVLIKWEDIKVGDVIKLQRDEDVPADVVLLHANGPNGVAYVSTASLDGETSLKSKQPYALLSRACEGLNELASCNATIVTEDPNIDLYEFNGRIEIDGERLPLDMSKVILRGSTLKNTPSATVLVVNTGEECRIRMNANRNIRAKSPELQKAANRVVIFLVFFVISLVIYCTVRYQNWTDHVENHAFFLKGAHFILTYTITANLMLLNTFIPMALYLSLEIVKVGQTWHQNQDIDMYDPVTDTPMQCNTSTILENLGQVTQVFSDKTGTLTENVMRFRGMSVGGYAFNHDLLSAAKEKIQKSSDSLYSQDTLAGSSIELQDYPKSATNDKPGSLTKSMAESEISITDLLKHMTDRPNDPNTQKMKLFLVAIALCHTCMAEAGEDGSTHYQAASPDEVALVEAAQEMMLLDINRAANLITLSAPGCAEECYEILDLIEFSAERRRMSVIVRFPDGRVCLICKGADSAIVPLLQSVAPQSSVMNIEPQSRPTRIQLQREDSQETLVDEPSFQAARTPLDTPLDDVVVLERCLKHLDEFASEGLRTLLYGHKFLSEQAYIAWKTLYSEAAVSLTDRQARVERVSQAIEKGLQLTGATAIEDKLQPGCAQTIDKLRKANIKVWMLTGDKRETAINIGHSAGICMSDSEIVNLSLEEVGKQIREAHAIRRQRGKTHSVLVLDGQTLAAIDADESLAASFFELVLLTNSVICCRASPSQKASLVRRSRKNIKHSVTLAIGDGANDIPMILEAHVGIGISGREGLQAARIADYSIAQFRFLQKLLFVHGHWNYVRTAKYLLLTFWKEAAFFLMQWHYQHFTGFTSMSLFDSPALTVFNTLFSSLCVIVYGVYEQDLSATTLLAIPELYTYTQRSRVFNFPKFFGWFILGVFESSVIFWLMWLLYGSVLTTIDNGLYALGDVCLGVAIILINTKVLIIEMHHKTMIVAISYAITVVGWFAFNLFLSGITKVNDTRTWSLKGGFLYQFGRSIEWWATFFCLLVSVIGLEVAILSIRKAYWPSDIDEFQELQDEEAIRRRLKELAMQNTSSGSAPQDRTSDPDQSDREMEGLLNNSRVEDNAQSSSAQIRRLCSGGVRSRKAKLGRDERTEDCSIVRPRRS